ncbi:MAG TPA: valine--tRNA ligase [Acholeplasmataceae bacterium]|jgi:valyl-tRNA synthetase|nr:valine--tRNA ligase [Acholeplasmataceae bacterium]
MKLKDLPTKYDFNAVEKGKYQTWVEKGYFTAGDISKKPFTIVIPPPNITGKLHLGHVLDTTLQDIVARRKRMEGFDVLYLPGMDHASIATQTKVEAELRKEGISRYDLGREKFIEKVWDWKEYYSKLIREQWAVIGLSLDYTRERFTLDEGLNRAVNEVFIRMYNDGLIYRGDRIINWDVQSKTALSNVEVIYEDIEGAFYSILYPFVEGKGGLVIATTRPETMFGDVALMVHPEDKRYQKYIGKSVYIPGTKRALPVIADLYVDQEFGTGVVKVTPAHDPNDFEVGLRHNLGRPLCMHEDGIMNELAGIYEGLERFECRRRLVEDLRREGYLKKVEPMVHSVGHSERTGVIVEPRLSRQWFVAMDKLAKELLKMQKGAGRISFIPERFEKIFNNWLNNIQDWCISRQLWWGHRIPAYYKGDEIYVGLEAPGPDWVQDEDSLDTWFSSALWPFSTLGWPKKTNDLERYFPNDVMVTGSDLIFFWVARMAFQSKYLLGTRPFKDVVFHGMIRDEIGRKVSKSLNNGADLMEVRDKYGIDSLRYFITTSTAMGQDVRFSEEKVEAAWNYINKIWNISRYLGLKFAENNYQNSKINPKLLNAVDKWILKRLNDVIRLADEFYDKYEFSEVARVIYKFAWDEFASWYLEMTKVVFGEGNEEEKINTCAVLNYVLIAVLKLLHPFMPFVTEEIYGMLEEGSITISAWPKANPDYDFNDANNIEIIYEIITNIRNLRAEKNVSFKKEINLELQIRNPEISKFIQENLHFLKRFTNFHKIKISAKEIDTAQKSVSVLSDVVVAVPLHELVNLKEELEKLYENQKKMQSEIERCEKLLSNPGFVNKAPAEKVEAEKTKLKDYQRQLEEIKKLIADYEE